MLSNYIFFYKNNDSYQKSFFTFAAHLKKLNKWEASQY